MFRTPSLEPRRDACDPVATCLRRGQYGVEVGHAFPHETLKREFAVIVELGLSPPTRSGRR